MSCYVIHSNQIVPYYTVQLLWPFVEIFHGMINTQAFKNGIRSDETRVLMMNIHVEIS